MNTQNSLATVLVLVALIPPAMAQNEDTPAMRMLAADKDGDGIVTREEFVANRSERFPGLDVDESGGLSKEEFKAALEGTPMKRFAGMAFGRADTDDDDSVSLGEWDAMPVRAFDRLDDNEDGQLDQEELSP